MESVTVTALKSKRARYGLLLGALVRLLVSTGCSSSTMTPDGSSSPDSGADELVRVEVGSSFERVCSNESQGVTLPVTAVTCTILAADGRVRANLDTGSGSPLLAVTYDGLEPGQLSTAGTAMTDVILSGPCPARAKDTPEPSTVELVELTRGDSPATDGQVETGSSLTLRVSCPASLTYDGGDQLGTTEQSPRRFEIVAQNCAVY